MDSQVGLWPGQQSSPRQRPPSPGLCFLGAEAASRRLHPRLLTSVLNTHRVKASLRLLRREGYLRSLAPEFLKGVAWWPGQGVTGRLRWGGRRGWHGECGEVTSVPWLTQPIGVGSRSSGSACYLLKQNWEHAHFVFCFLGFFEAQGPNVPRLFTHEMCSVPLW